MIQPISKTVILSVLLLPAAGVATAADPIFTVYMSPDGSDGNSGKNEKEPVRSLFRVQQVLVQNNPATDVEVRIKGGTYVAPPMRCEQSPEECWRFYVPGRTISFMPIDYEYGEGRGGIAELPVFRNARNPDGTYPAGFWFQPRLPTDKNHPLYGGGASGLRFYYLQVEYYSSGGVSIYGDSERDIGDESYDP
ncbi:MAG: hypothetical protein ACRD7E_20690, partial [Bryobacteraceae bacterium]